MPKLVRKPCTLGEAAIFLWRPKAIYLTALNFYPGRQYRITVPSNKGLEMERAVCVRAWASASALGSTPAGENSHRHPAPNESDTTGPMRNWAAYSRLLWPKIFLFGHLNGSKTCFHPWHGLLKAEMCPFLPSFPVWVEWQSLWLVLGHPVPQVGDWPRGTPSGLSAGFLSVNARLCLPLLPPQVWAC